MLELNKIYNMDCLEGMKQIEDKSIDLVITDPPYNIGKGEWDKIKGYYDWIVNIFKECERVLKENGTLWFFHISFNDLSELHQRIVEKTSFRHKQLVIINKGLGSVAGRCNTEVLRSFPRATEYLQFYTFEDLSGATQLSETYSILNPMAKYLRDEFEKADVSNKEIAKLFPSKTGGLTGCVSNWLLGLNFPLKEQYNKMQSFLGDEYLRREYEDLRREYEDLRREYEDLRYTFNLPLRTTDVWNVNFYESKNNGHLAQKPIKLLLKLINTTTKKGDIVLDPFSGSGTTAVASKQLGRQYLGFEINPEYCKIAERRLAQESWHSLKDKKGLEVFL